MTKVIIGGVEEDIIELRKLRESVEELNKNMKEANKNSEQLNKLSEALVGFTFILLILTFFLLTAQIPSLVALSSIQFSRIQDFAFLVLFASVSGFFIIFLNTFIKRLR